MDDDEVSLILQWQTSKLDRFTDVMRYFSIVKWSSFLDLSLDDKIYVRMMTRKMERKRRNMKVKKLLRKVIFFLKVYMQIVSEI
jgi:hypothetical protein